MRFGFLTYSDKDRVVRALIGDNGVIKYIDYKVFTQNGKNFVGSEARYSIKIVEG